MSGEMHGDFSYCERSFCENYNIDQCGVGKEKKWELD